MLGSFNMVTVVDYGIGNVFSVRNVFEKLGVRTELTSDSNKIINADHLILPGVGAFSVGMENLTKANLVEPVKEFVKKGNPFLGICLGMQMLLDKSYEFGEFQGLGLIEGTVERIQIPRSKDSSKYKIPHIGWSEIEATSEGQNWTGTILEQTQSTDSFYFVHSYSVRTKKPENLLATAMYGDFPIQAAISNENIFGVQFHPEKSGNFGFKVLNSFLNI